MVSLQRIASTLLVGVTLAFVLGATLTPPDPYSQLLFVGPALLFMLPAAYVVAGRTPGLRRHVLFLLAAAATLWVSLLVLDGLGVTGLVETVLRVGLLAAALLLAAWVAYVPDAEIPGPDSG
ncbi:hypothetical protein [Halomicrococcus sp. NG-SE-24]|uniref:hypothetical protein n=1 Tax=Halomicrococcus sp. NG-SE-24 TaxID=3436928 RepID=UPI003D983694